LARFAGQRFAGQPGSKAKVHWQVADPIPGMIVAINKYLQAYHMYRAEALSRPEVRRLDIELAHDLDETGMPCVCLGHGVGFLGILLDLPERV
jgi:hypothetical protein